MIEKWKLKARYLVQVVVFVLEYHRRPALESSPRRLSVNIIVLDFYPRVSLHVAEDLREGQAAFLAALHLRRALHYLWIQQNHFIFTLGGVALFVGHHQPLVDPHLRCRETDAFGRVHNEKHLPRDLLQLLIERFDTRIFSPQQRMRILQDAQRRARNSTGVFLLLRLAFAADAANAADDVAEAAHPRDGSQSA